MRVYTCGEIAGGVTLECLEKRSMGGAVIEERELNAAKFWQYFDDVCRAHHRESTGTSYERDCLLVLFVWFGREMLDFEPIPVSRGDNAPALRQWWSRTMRGLDDALGFEGSGRRDELAENWRFHSQAYELFKKGLPSLRNEVAYFFDYRFVRLAGRETGTHRHLSHFSASLVNALADPRSEFVDAYCSTGELFATSGTERWRRFDDKGRRNFIFQVGAFELETRMRLALHGKDPKSYQRFDPQAGTRASRTMFRIDPPARKAMPARGQDTTFGQISSATEMLAELQRWINLDSAVVVTRGNERASPNRLNAGMRRELVDDGRLVAVIDLPRPPGARIDKSAWVIGPRHISENRHILMVDVCGLGDPSSHQEFGVFAEFAGRLVRSFMGERISARWATSSHEDAAAQVRHVFDREFHSGYRDVLGLCRVVSREEIRGNGGALIASRYVRPAQRSAWLSGIDGTPLTELFLNKRGEGRTVYLIGNNGEGKSLLLREIAQASSELRRKTVGISCSASDRFPLSSEKVAGFESFIYEGARTSEQAANYRRTATDVCSKFFEIHCSDQHLQVFVEVLRLIEFDAKRFVMPLSASGSNTQSERFLERTFELTDDADRNRMKTREASSGNMQIALMRSDSKGGITPFRDLSSGEQQIVSLVVKILAHAQRGCLMLIDEPEISLHVSWQRVLPRVLSTIASSFSCDILVATHSPLIISSAPEDSLCFAARMQRLTPIPSRYRRSVESILFKGFGTYTTNNRLIHERCAAIVADAISVFNQEEYNDARPRQLVAELKDMRRTVLAAAEHLDRAGVNKSLELIKKAQEAIQKLSALHEDPDSEEREGVR
ncbi:ATP-binding protein [Paraburkholderia sediminicola]|nr:ATP-binding protein [Paraburkholderia sediminicola]